MAKLWSILWTIWSLGLLAVILTIWTAASFGLNFDLPHIYVILTIGVLNGLVLASLIHSGQLLGFYDFWQLEFLVSSLIGLGQWFLFYKLGKNWLLNWQNNLWHRKFLFPIILISYYGLAGTLSIFLFALAVSEPLATITLTGNYCPIY